MKNYYKKTQKRVMIENNYHYSFVMLCYPPSRSVALHYENKRSIHNDSVTLIQGNPSEHPYDNVRSLRQKTLSMMINVVILTSHTDIFCSLYLIDPIR